MKKTVSTLLSLLLTFASVTAFAAGMSGVEVKAEDKSGKVVYHGQTDSSGKFTTPTLPAGAYVFQFSSEQRKGFQIALAGPKRASQTKGSGSGLAFNVEVTPAAKVSGQATATGAAQAGEKLPANVKIVNGKRYVLVPGQLGSNMGARWVPEEEAQAMNPNSTRRDAGEFLQRAQDLGAQGSASGR